MEYPDTGEQCSIQDCKQLDFLPFVCEHCRITFCKMHFHMSSHKCSRFVDNVKQVKERSKHHVCSKDNCKQTSPVELLCPKCKKHYCIEHRYHGCVELSGQDKTKVLKKWQIPKKQFAEAKAVADQEVSDSLKKSKNTAMANKVQLMRVKGSAIGPKNVPTNERCYFLVHSPITLANKSKVPPKGIYVNQNWTLGRATDAIADVLKIPNNNTSGIDKLRLFHHVNGTLICNEMDTVLTKLFEDSELIDGQPVILEYSNNDTVDPTLYVK